MDIRPDTRVMKIVQVPELRAVLQWYGLPIADRWALRLSLEDFCYEFSVDLDDLLVELSASQIDDDDAMSSESDTSSWL